ncbi:ras association domain-containing protein 5 isoform X2 [Biomphalaria glabrata]|nr:ras association domain-containing protein 5 isoform X2 [Biomphalaria glabrata]
MEDSGYYSQGAENIQVCSSSDSASSIFNLKFSDLPASKYYYFLYGFKDEQDFEDFKQDLKDFQKLKRNCQSGDQKSGGQLSYAALKEDLEIICRPNSVCQNRRKHHHERSKPPTNSVISKATSDKLDANENLHVITDRSNGKPCKAHITEEALSKPDNFGLRADFDRRSGVFGFDRRSGISSGIRDILMDFLNGDEHFQEFERVFDTVNKARLSRQMDNMPFLSSPESRRRLSRDNANYLARSEQSLGNSLPSDNGGDVSLNSDLFSDFFDNDETFLEFEKEFENFRNVRKSSLLSGLSQMGSSRDIFGDFKSYCDKNVRSGSVVSVNSCASQDEAKPSCADEHPQGGLIWRSIEDWEKILKKMRRNSRLLLDGCSHRSKYGLSRGGFQQKHLKTQSMADLSGCHGHDDDHRSFLDLKDNSHSAQSCVFTDLSLPASIRLSSLRNCDSSSSLSDDAGDDHSSSSLWSDQLNDGSHYSSTSTLCSSREDISCSFSCSCCSDLHIDEDTDEDFSYSQSPTSRNRSHSLINIGPRVTKLDHNHSCSADDLLCLIRPRSGQCPAIPVLPDHRDTRARALHRMPTCDSSDADDDEGCPEWSCNLSDVGSEQYHTASSDFSSQFSTAKSDLSSDLAAIRSKQNIEEKLSPNGTDKPVTPGCFHSYHGREKGKLYTDSSRPHCGCACQYTCHQHCVPAVTLNCKSVSEDSVQVKTPTPTEPRPQLETSLSLGNIHARPGCARSVTLPNSQGSTLPTQQHPRICSPHIAQGTNSQVYVPGSSSSPLLACSASEGYVTAQLPGGISRPTTLSSATESSSHPIANANPQTLVQSSSSLVDNVNVTGQLNSSCQVSSSHNVTHHITEQDVTLQLHGPEVNSEEATEKDETDSGYRSGTIPEDKLPRVPSQDTLDRQELKRKIAKFNHFVPSVSLKVAEKESFQGFLKVTLNLIRPITMELGARPPSIYELLTREHIIEENTQQVAFYMPRDTHKSLHINSDTTTKEVITSLLKKFHIIDHPRKFAMYEQEFSERNKLVRLRRLTDKDFPLRAMLTWDPERMKNYRIVLQENETGEIVWDAFSLPELNNFLKVLDREEKETILELKHKYAYMRQYMERRLTELRTIKAKK